ncbi:MAG: hypothetical protein N839_0012035 [Desulfofustis sp. PB-SRB1]|jgi:hypothetical protein|nr:hypothetical protein [Desulfofustis sp. PB-SRB1]MBM1003126.1 hypothetical protein [Desulfofustis sp. PB-SRB1]HBH30686.1 hypothetical protein [Desulfofustis sp.]
MKWFVTSFIFFFSSLLLVSCANHPPRLTDSGKGLVAIPVKGVNTSQLPFSRDFLLSSSMNTFEVMIYPQVGEQLVYSKELEPGSYQIDEVYAVLDRTKQFSSTQPKVKKSLNIFMYLTVEPGTITVAPYLVNIRQRKSPNQPHSYGYSLIVEEFSNERHKQFISDHLILEKNSGWKVMGQ